MFRKSNFFAAALFCVSTGTAAFAQQTVPPSAPTNPNAPQRVEKQFQIFTGDGGSYLGVESQDVTKDNFSKFGLREVRGVAIEKVVENSPAAQAGLQTGDVVVRFNGEEVTSARKLSRLISEIAPDHQAEITVLRGGSEKNFNVTMGKRPTPTFQNSTALGEFWGLPGIPEFPRNLPQTTPLPQNELILPNGQGNRQFYMFRGDSRQIGVGVTALNDQLGDYFGVPGGKGILINNVRENSPAAKAGLKAGDVIVEADGKAVANQIDLVRTINEKKEGDVTLTIVRNKNRQTVKVTPEKTTGSSGAPQNFIFQTDAPNPQQRQLQLLMQQVPDEPAPKLQRHPPPRVQ